VEKTAGIVVMGASVKSETSLRHNEFEV